jgi:SAM-dependent methyltransferase
MNQNTPWQAPARLFKGWSDAQKVVSLIRARGVRVALAEARSTTLYRLAALEGRHFDRTHGVETNELVRVANLTLRSSARGGAPNYVPSLVSMLRLAMSQLPRDLSDYVFIDVGSGKGRVLLAAAQYKFKRVLGVEFAQELHEQALRNILAFRGARQTREILSVLSDARDFEIPEERCVVYIFGAGAEYAELFEAVIRKLERSYSRVPRAIFVVMINVEAGAVIEKFPLFTELVVRGVLAKLLLRRLGSLRVFATSEARVSR